MQIYIFNFKPFFIRSIAKELYAAKLTFCFLVLGFSFCFLVESGSPKAQIQFNQCIINKQLPEATKVGEAH